MTPLFTDIIVVGIVFLSGYLATIRGFTREVIAILQWFLALLGAFAVAPYIAPYVELIPFVGGIMQECQLSMIGGFIIGFAFTLAFMWFAFKTLIAKISITYLRPVDQGLGFLFGAFRGFFFIVLCYMVYSLFVPQEIQPTSIADSSSVAFLSDAADNMIDAIPNEMPSWLQTRIDALMGNCTETVVPS